MKHRSRYSRPAASVGQGSASSVHRSAAPLGGSTKRRTTRRQPEARRGAGVLADDMTMFPVPARSPGPAWRPPAHRGLDEAMEMIFGACAASTARGRAALLSSSGPPLGGPVVGKLECSSGLASSTRCCSPRRAAGPDTLGCITTTRARHHDLPGAAALRSPSRSARRSRTSRLDDCRPTRSSSASRRRPLYLEEVIRPGQAPAFRDGRYHRTEKIDSVVIQVIR
jgi:hypothetical protein